MMNVTHRRTAVLGAGRSGKAAAALLRLHGADVRVFDSNPVEGWDQDVALTPGATEQDGRDYAAELVVISPGIETDSPFVRAFAASADELIGETELASRFYTGTTIAITGTNGKTTTTALIEAILLAAGRKAAACGNYGIPLSEILANGEHPDILAMEVSSFQMETIRDFHPQISIWLNFAPDHMDRYKTVEEYFEAKQHIFDNQTSADLAVIRHGELLPPLRPKVVTFSSTDDTANLFYRDGQVFELNAPLLDLRGTALEHAHNAENVMAALLACRALLVDTPLIQKVVRSFVPPGHRCELVRSLNGVDWYNDSKATNLHALEAAIRSQTRPVVLIAGGKDKGLDYAPLLPLLEGKVRGCVVFGEIAGQLERTFSDTVPTVSRPDLTAAVAAAAAMAQEGDVVLFSPGTSSFDMFTGYVERGKAFRDAVLALNPHHH